MGSLNMPAATSAWSDASLSMVPGASGDPVVWRIFVVLLGLYLVLGLIQNYNDDGDDISHVGNFYREFTLCAGHGAERFVLTDQHLTSW